MRVYPVTVAPQRVVSNRNCKKCNSTPVVQPSFKGWKAGAGAAIGAGLGLLLGTVLSGGLLAPLFVAEVGTFAGAVAGSSQEGGSDSEYTDMDTSYRDY